MFGLVLPCAFWGFEPDNLNEPHCQSITFQETKPGQTEMNQINPHAEIDPVALDSSPFFNYSPSLPAVLFELRCTLAISTYQAGKLIFVSSLDGQHIRMFGKNFPRPMGICVDGNKLAIAGKYAVEVFSYSKGLARSFPEKPKHYDSMYFPQATYHTG